MRKPLLWTSTIVSVVGAVVFLIWALQTAWLGSFPGKDKALYATWAALELGAGVVLIILPIVLWIRHWRQEEKAQR